MFVHGKPFQLSFMEHSCFLGPFISYEENKVFWILSQGLYSQHFIFLVTCEWAQYARVFVPAKPFQLSVMYKTFFLGPFVSYDEYEVLWILSQGLYSQHSIFFVTYKWVPAYCYVTLLRLGPISYAMKKIKCREYCLRGCINKTLFSL